MSGIAVSASLLGSSIGRFSEVDANVIHLIPQEKASSKPGENAAGGFYGAEADTAQGESSVADSTVLPQRTTSKTGHVVDQSGDYQGELKVYDDIQTWSSETHVDLFRESYDSTVESDDKEKVIAPGTSNFYNFTLKNNGNIPLDYSVSLKVETYLGEKDTYSEIPIEWRLIARDGTKLSDWSRYNERTEVLEQGTLKVRHQDNYTIEWRWNYEQGKSMDTADTDMGDMAVEQSLGVNAAIYVHAEQSADLDGKPSASEDNKKGGEKNNAPLHGNEAKTGDTFNILLYIILIAISACGILLLFVTGRRRKKDEDAADDRK